MEAIYVRYCTTPLSLSLFQPQIIANRGYPAETHTVVTPDGYILTLHRIPRGRIGKFIFYFLDWSRKR